MNNNKVLQVILERFHDLADQIEQLFLASEGFREICEDYVLCLNEVQKIESGEQVTRGEYLKDYEETLAELEDELKLMVKNDKTTNIRE